MLLTYDGDGNRVSETVGGTTTKFLVDDLNPAGLPQVLDEVVSGSVTRTYAYGYQRISENQQISGTWTPSFYGFDGHSVRFLTNSSGTATDSCQYDAFGMPIASTGTTSNNYRYSGERLDGSIGLYDLRARYYNQATGRFWARDPMEGVACTPLTYNPYIYGIDDPVNNTDPTGQQAIIEYLLLYHWIQGFHATPSYPRTCIGKGGGWARPIAGYCQYICYLDYPINAGLQPISFLNVSLTTVLKSCPQAGDKCPFTMFLEGGSPWAPVSRDWKIVSCQQYRQ